MGYFSVNICSLICQSLDDIVEMSIDAIQDDVEILPEFLQEEKKIQDSLISNIANLKEYGAELDRLIESSNASPVDKVHVEGHEIEGDAVEGHGRKSGASSSSFVDSRFDIWADGVPKNIIAIMKNENVETSVDAHKVAYLNSLKEMKSSCDRMQGKIKAASEALEKADSIQTSLYNSYKFFAGNRLQSKAPTNNTKKLFKDYQKMMK